MREGREVRREIAAAVALKAVHHHDCGGVQPTSRRRRGERKNGRIRLRNLVVKAERSTCSRLHRTKRYVSKQRLNANRRLTWVPPLVNPDPT
jgi:hypothetical protein